MWTFTVTRLNRDPGFIQDVPYVLALVELDEGVKMFTNIVECNPDDVTIGMPVEVTFVRATDRGDGPLLQARSLSASGTSR